MQTIGEIWIDIDGTLAYKNEALLVRLYAQYLQLAIAPETLLSVHDVSTFERLPEVVQFKASVGLVKYDYLLELLVYLPEHLEASALMDNAVPGMQTLSTSLAGVPVGYCTARKGNTERWNREVQEATRQWLHIHQFPQADQTQFCADSRAKLQWIASKLAVAPEPQPVLFIDDLYDTLVAHFCTLEPSEKDLLSQFLILGAFGAETCPQEAPFCLLPLPSWETIGQFIALLAEHMDCRYGKEDISWQTIKTRKMARRMKAQPTT
jgi:hypothetical protein